MVFNDGHYLQADGYYRAVNVLDVIPAYEEFTAESGHGEIQVLVADRFMIRVTAEGSDLRTLQNSAQQVPMAGIAALK
jgi:hypothetical protein